MINVFVGELDLGGLGFVVTAAATDARAGKLNEKIATATSVSTSTAAR